MPKINIASVKQLRSVLRTAMSPKVRFRILASTEEVKEGLLGAYEASLIRRNRTFIEDENTSNNLTEAARWLSGEIKKVGIIFYGACGNGKTTTMDAIWKLIELVTDPKVAINDTKMYASTDRPTACYVTSKDIVNLALNKDDKKEFYKKANIPILFVDDFGAEAAEINQYGNIITPMTDLLSIRYERQLLTIISTNLEPSVVREKYGDRLADRFNEMMHVVKFKSDKTYRVR